MKNIVRAFALSLVVTGAFASSHVNNSAPMMMTGKVSAFPIPQCEPGRGNDCGICNGGGCIIQ